MPPRDAIRFQTILIFLAALSMALLSAACDVVVEDRPDGASFPGQRSYPLALNRQLPQYEVAISAVDFDPPLSRETLQDAGNPVKLVAAVENKGTKQLSGLTVVARIENQKGDFSEQDQVGIDKLIPGELRVVEFDGIAPLPDLPRSPSYRIRITVDGPQLDSWRPKPTRELLVRVLDQ
jgi:hypothetical protein